MRPNEHGDLTGMELRLAKVIGPAPRRSNAKRWLCQLPCGHQQVVFQKWLIESKHKMLRCVTCRKILRDSPVRLCDKCLVPKPNTSEFFELKNGFTTASCRDCRRAYRREWHKKNPTPPPPPKPPKDAVLKSGLCSICYGLPHVPCRRCRP